MNYILRKSYPGSPKEGTKLHLHKPIVGFPYYTDEDHIFHIKKEHVEDCPEYYQKITGDMLTDLKNYFAHTSKEQIKKDWDKSKENAPKNSPLVSDFIEFSKNIQD